MASLLASPCRRVSALVTLAIFALPGFASGAPFGSSTDPIGRIVFTAEVGGVPQLFVIGADGHGLRQVTHSALGASHAAWSPDGKSLVFVLTGRSATFIYRVNANGGGLKRLSPPCGQRCLGDDFPVYSRDGSKIAFERDSIVGGYPGSVGVAIFVMNADGTQPRQLTTLSRTHEDHEAQWLPNGRIAFTRILTSGRHNGAGALFEINVDGTRARELTPFALEYPNDVKWSPNGAEILYDSNNETNSSQPTNVFTMRSDGTDKTQLTHFVGMSRKGFVGAWSPDGNWIVWHQSATGERNQLFVMNRNGRHLRQLTHLASGGKPQSPAWGRSAT